MKKVIFWDFDGTLVHCDHLWSNSVLEILRENGIEADLGEVRPHMQTGYPWDLKEPHPEIRLDAWWPFLYRKFETVYRSFGIPEERARALGPLTREKILDLRKFHLYGDTVSSLERASSLNWENWILSNNYPELREVLSELGLAGYFSGLIVSGEVGLDKPQPEIFRLAFEKAGRPSRCCMIGDNPLADIEGAKNFGIPALLVHREAPCRARGCFGMLAEAVNFLSEHEDSFCRT